MGFTNGPSSFMRHRLPWIVAALLVVGIILITFVLWRSTTRATQPMGDGATLQDPPTTSIDPAPQSSQASRPGTTHGDPAAMALRKLAQHNVERTAQRKRVQTRVDDTNAALAARFREEKIDPAWSPGKERRLAELGTSSQIREINASIKNLSVNCKSTVCMVSGDFASTSVGDDWFTLYMNNVGAEVPYAAYHYVPGKDGRVTIQVYTVGRK